jgi:hypothetical protein
MPTKKEPSVTTRKNILGRDVKITKTGNKKTREVTGNYVSKTRTATDTKGGKKVTKSRIEVDPAMGYGSVRNVTKFTGAAGLKRALSSKPGAVRKTVYDMKSEVDPKRAKQSGTKMSVRELAEKKYKGSNLPKRFKD